METAELIRAASSGDARALGRLCSLIERGGPAARAVMAELYPVGGQGWTTAVTGAPGVGKSTLGAELVDSMLSSGDRVGVLAVDPSSPITGGAILGDRIRMGRHAGNPSVFIRSLANRGHLGGISTATPAIAAALEGLGFAEILIETVGVGQSEVEVAASADTTVVVVAAGWGDDVQAAKAGFLEIADVFVVNKADRDGADGTVRDIVGMLDVGRESEWRPPVIATVASESRGIKELWQAVRDHRRFLADSDEISIRRTRRAAHDLAMALRESVDHSLNESESGSELVAAIAERTVDPWTAADRLLRSSQAPCIADP